MNQKMKQKSMQNKFPEIQFRVDKEAEKEVGEYYITQAFKNKDFWFLDKFVKDYLELLKIKELKQDEAVKFLNKKIDEYYFKEEDRLNKIKKEIELKWNKIKDKFFTEAEKIFDNNKRPNGEYTANISLFGMFRLVPGSKKFSIPSNDYAGNPPGPEHINHTIIHEMMHIIFEDFYKKHFDKDILPLRKYYDFLEIINYIVLNLSQIKELTGWVSYPYPNQEQRCKHLEKVYKESRTMKEFVEKAIPYLNETKEN